MAIVESRPLLSPSIPFSKREPYSRYTALLKSLLTLAADLHLVEAVLQDARAVLRWLAIHRQSKYLIWKWQRVRNTASKVFHL